MPDAHSKFSASNFEADTLCPGRRVMQKGLPDRGSKYADEGTAAHELLAACIDANVSAASQIGTTWEVNGKEWPVTTEMAGAVQIALDNIKEIVGDGMLLSEQRVNYSDYLGVEARDGWGTSDIIAARQTELQIHDYKHGMGVEVDAEDNPQMKLYGLGGLAQAQGILGDFDTVRLVIHQPRIKSAPSEWVISVADLEAWGRGEARRSVGEQLGAERMRESAAMSQDEWERIYLRPNEKSCKFCKAKATCPALRNEVAQTVFESPAADPSEFATLAIPEKAKAADSAWLSAVLKKADLIEDYLKAVRGEVEVRLLGGDDVPDFKLVQGRQGDRAWKDKAEAEAALKSMRLKHDQMFTYSLISPTAAEALAPKLSKSTNKKTGEVTYTVKPGQPETPIGERQWKKLQEQIVRAPGKKHVAPVSDPRPALVLTSAADDFATVSTDQPVHDFA